MSDLRKYFVARGPFHVPAPIIEEGDTVELDSAVAAQFVREGTLNPVDFKTDDGGNPVVDVPVPDPAADPAAAPQPEVAADPASAADPAADPAADAGAPAAGE